MNPDLDGLRVFFGQADPTATRVYAQLPCVDAGGGWRLEGTVEGPRSDRARTLPAVTALTDLGPGDSLLAEAIVTEPCFWTPGAPYLYDVRVTLRRGEEQVAEAMRSLGIRPLGTDGRRLRMAGRNWVLRGVHRSLLSEADLRRCADEATALVVDDIPEEDCVRASREGTLLVVGLAGAAAQQAAAVAQLGRHAAVGLLVFDRGAAAGGLRAAARNALFAERFGAGDEVRPADWADCAVCEVNDANRFAERIERCSIPVLALRRAMGRLPLEEARARCDRLQRDLAGKAQLAGYLV